MADVIKVLNTEIALDTTTPNTVYGATLVRLINTANSPTDVLVTLTDASNATVATFTLGHEGTGYSTLNLEKGVTQKLKANTGSSVYAVPIAYK